MAAPACVALFVASALSTWTLSSTHLAARGFQSIDSIEASHNWIAPSDYIAIERVDDPQISGMSCYVGLSNMGGFASLIGAQEEPYHFSIDCIKTGSIEFKSPIGEFKQGTVIASQFENIWLKRIRVSRFFDHEKQTIIYMVWASHLVKGETANGISAVSLREELKNSPYVASARQQSSDEDVKKIGRLEASHNWIAPSDDIVIERVDDPKVSGVSCYAAVPDIGGFASLIGAQHVPYNFSLECVQTEPLRFAQDPDTLKQGEVVSQSLENIYFKTVRISRFWDHEVQALVYVIWGSHLIKGETVSGISAVPVDPQNPRPTDADFEPIGRVKASHNWFTPSDYILAERVDDAEVNNVSCYVGLPEIGGFGSLIWMQKSPYYFSIQCLRTGPLPPEKDIAELESGATVASQVKSLRLKWVRVSRFYDAEKKALVYLVWASHLIKGETANGISAVLILPE